MMFSCDLTYSFDSLQKKPTTLFHIANREIVTNPIDFLQSTMMDDRKKTISELIFSDRVHVKKMVDEECKSKFLFELSLNFLFFLIIFSSKLQKLQVEKFWKRCFASIE